MSSETHPNIRYAGFNIRLLANLIDTILLLILTLPLMMVSQNMGYVEHPPRVQQALVDFQHDAITQAQFFEIMIPYMAGRLPDYLMYTAIDFVIIGAIFVGFWKWKNSTPGKILLKIRIVDDKTFEDPSTKQYIIRFIGYIVSAIPFMLGFFIIPLTKKKRGLHDYMSGTSVVYTEPLDPEKEKKMMRVKTAFFLIVIVIFAIFVASR